MTSRLSVASQASGVEDFAALLERFFESAPLAFQIYGTDGHCVLANDAFSRLFATEATREYNVFTDDAPARCALRDAVRRALAGETVRFAVGTRDSLWPTASSDVESGDIALEATAFPLRDADGVRQVALCLQYAPIERTQRSATFPIQEDRQEVNERLRRAFEAG